MTTVFAELAELDVVRIWEGVVGRVVGGEQVTVAVIELDPSSIVPEHTHEHEQIGVCVTGSLSFTAGAESREIGVGVVWCIPGGMPHEVRTGPAGAVVVEIWAPRREDWAALERRTPRSPQWPR